MRLITISDFNKFKAEIKTGEPEEEVNADIIGKIEPRRQEGFATFREIVRQMDEASGGQFTEYLDQLDSVGWDPQSDGMLAR